MKQSGQRRTCNITNNLASLEPVAVTHQTGTGKLVIDEVQKQELQYLRTKKRNPYSFRRSAITDDSDIGVCSYKESALGNGSKQTSRYIKHRMGDELKNKIHELHGIKIANKQPQMVSRTCWKCQHVNKLE